MIFTSERGSPSGMVVTDKLSPPESVKFIRKAGQGQEKTGLIEPIARDLGGLIGSWRVAYYYIYHKYYILSGGILSSES